MIRFLKIAYRKIKTKNRLFGSFLNRMRLAIKIKRMASIHQKLLLRVKVKKTIRIVFMLVLADTWKLNVLYWLAARDKRFDPIVVICPILTKGHEFFETELRKAKDLCERNEYEYLVAIDEYTLKPIDIKKSVVPDMVFYTNPNNFTFRELGIFNFLDTLTCYVPYSFRIDNLYKYEFDNDLVNLVWMNFYESSMHKSLAIKHARNAGRNVFVSGFPMMDDYKDRVVNEDIWKAQDRKKKRLIWAPHWTIKGHQKSGLNWSCFLKYHEAVLILAEKYKQQIQFALKPHPLLRDTLSQPSLWGKKKTTDYFDRWQTAENCQIVEGDYVDLFCSSDALIHDSGSFMTEYLSLNKPIAYTLSEEKIEGRFNEFGWVALGGHELIKDQVELMSFIENLINGIDTLRDKRKEVLSTYELVLDQSASVNILNRIKKELG